MHPNEILSTQSEKVLDERPKHECIANEISLLDDTVERASRLLSRICTGDVEPPRLEKGPPPPPMLTLREFLVEAPSALSDKRKRLLGIIKDIEAALFK